MNIPKVFISYSHDSQEIKLLYQDEYRDFYLTREGKFYAIEHKLIKT